MILLLFPLALLLYTFLLYPLMLMGVAAVRDESEHFPVPDEASLSTLDLLIATKNEERCIEEKLVNSLALNYPKEKLNVIVLANGCTDNTISLAKQFESKGVRIVEEGDIGKTEAQNRAVASSKADLLVFSDANTLYDEDALLHLAAPFVDSSVGAVSGRHIYEQGDRAADSTEGFFWNTLETRLKRAESDSGGMIGANGSIYAVRRELYIPLPPEVISDFIEPTLIAANGHRTVYAESAIARERAESDLGQEMERKQRIVRRSFTTLLRYPELISPSRSGRLAWLIWSKKILRWFAAPIALLAFVVATLRVLAGKPKSLDWAVFGGGSLFGFFAMLGRGIGSEESVKGLTHAYYFAMLMYASLVGIYKGIREGAQHTWERER